MNITDSGAKSLLPTTATSACRSPTLHYSPSSEHVVDNQASLIHSSNSCLVQIEVVNDEEDSSMAELDVETEESSKFIEDHSDDYCTGALTQADPFVLESE